MREQRNKDMKAVLTSTQYTKYENMEKDFYKDSTTTKQQ